jgi:hypothetical protein
VALPSPVDHVFPVVCWLPRTTAFGFDVGIRPKFGTLSLISKTPQFLHKVLSCGVGSIDRAHPDNPNIAVQLQKGSLTSRVENRIQGLERRRIAFWASCPPYCGA